MKTLLTALLIALSFAAHAGEPQDSLIDVQMKLSTAAYVYAQAGTENIRARISEAAKDTNNRDRLVTIAVTQGQLVAAGWQLRNSPEGPFAEVNNELLLIIQSLLPTHPYLYEEFMRIRATNIAEYENSIRRGLEGMRDLQIAKTQNE